MDLEAQVDLSGLSTVERELLRLGVTEWERSSSKDEVARLLGYDSATALPADVDRLAGLAASGGPMTRRDYRRVLLATELAFASETLGWSRDWESDTGFADRDTITVLRGIQEKTAGIVYGPDDRISGFWAQPQPQPQPQPAWTPISMDVDDEYWEPFRERFDFRPGVHTGRPAIAEPDPSVTVDLGPIFSAGSHAGFAAGVQALNSLTLLALVRVLEPDTTLVVLDWQHQTYRFWPHRLACQPDPQWRTQVFPNGDYYVFLTEDLSMGTFGHPWERTLCVFGEPLVSVAAPLLTSWLPIKRSSASWPLQH